jgi:hypothetical protein
MRTLPGVMALVIGIIVVQLVATPASASSLKYFKQFSQQSSQSLNHFNSGNHVPVVGPKLPWLAEFTGGNPDHYPSVFDGLTADQSERLSLLRDAFQQSVFGDRGALREYIGELPNNHFDGHRFAMGADKFGFRFIDGEAKNWDWKNSKPSGGQADVVPIPSAVWLMLSGLLVIGSRAKSRILKNDSHAMTEA